MNFDSESLMNSMQMTHNKQQALGMQQSVPRVAPSPLLARRHEGLRSPLLKGEYFSNVSPSGTASIPILSKGELQLFHQMGPDPVPEMHRGVELIIHSIARMAGRQHSKKHSQNTVIT